MQPQKSKQSVGGGFEFRLEEAFRQSHLSAAWWAASLVHWSPPKAKKLQALTEALAGWVRRR